MKTLAKIALAALMLASTLAVPFENAYAGEQKKPAVAFVASANREPFHKVTCRWAAKISSQNLQTFKTRQEAINAGHRPCKVCKP